MLRSFKQSGATYLLTTTFTGPRPNRETAAGVWRTLNMTLPPFNFPEPKRVIIEKCTEAGGTFGDKSLALWLLADVPLHVGEGRADGAALPIPEFVE